MKILYDISLLGRGHANEANRTGLYRFAEETFKKFQKVKGIDLYLTASQFNFDEVQEYLNEHCPELLDKLLKPRYSLTNTVIQLVRWSLKQIAKADIKAAFISKSRNNIGFCAEYLNLNVAFIPKSMHTFFDVYFSPKDQIPTQIKKIKSIKKVIFIHDMIPLVLPQFSMKSSNFFYKHLMKSITTDMLVLCNSETTKKDFRKFRFDIKEIKVLPLCTSEIFKPHNADEVIPIKNEYGIPSDAKYFISVSSLNPRKNFPHVIKCFVAFIRKYKIEDLYLVVTGPAGWNYDDIFKTVRGMGIYKDKIITTGFVNDKDIPYLYSGALGAICASLYEGFGYPALEAMQCGTATIASDNSSMAEIVAEAGILVSPNDEVAMIKALNKIYEDSSYRKQLVKAGLKRAKEYSQYAFGEKLIGFLK
jgi:glycosyltransferase involved in cell wall biosynthesis